MAKVIVSTTILPSQLGDQWRGGGCFSGWSHLSEALECHQRNVHKYRRSETPCHIERLQHLGESTEVEHRKAKAFAPLTKL